jgi:MscS family membrane protein
VIPISRLADSRGASPWTEISPVASAARTFEDRRPPEWWHANQQPLDRIRSILARSIGRRAREAVISISLLVCVFGLAGIRLVHASEPSWAGMWDTEWRGGGARITLQENDGKVTGEYPAYGGKIEGEVHDRELTGHWIEGPRSGGIDFVLASDGRSFMGRFDNGEWWTGRRIFVSAREFVDQSGAREAFRTFVVAGNAARRGSFDELSEAAAVLDFGEAGAGMVPGQKLAAAGELFDLVNLTTFHLWTIPGKRAPGDHLDLILAQAGSGAALPLSLVKKDAGWFIVYPSADVLTNARKALLARSNGRLPPPGDYKRRTSARDAVRSFLDAFYDWEGAGHDQALDALDLSDFSEAVRVYEGELAAQYLKEVIDRIGDVVPQEIPDDPTSFEPYTLFSHPAGRIVVAATGVGDKLSWKFDANSVRTARDLFVAVEDMPALASAGPSAPRSGYFRLRRWISDFSPALLRPVGSLEAWQAVGWVLVLAVSFGLALALSAVLLAILRRATGGEHSSTELELRWPLRLSLTFSIYKQLIPFIGLPDLAKRFSVGATGVVLAIALMWVGWRLIDFVSEMYFSRAKSARAPTDHVVMSLTFGALKLVLIAAGCFAIAVELSLPYEGVLASLSIGGLAVAFASRETLSNVFGAGILAVDRPFKSGDRIIAGEIQGRVERVGIRSTRIRTDDDSLVIVPNGKLSDSVVNNLGARRNHMIRAKLPLSYATTVDQIVKFQEGVMELIANTPHTVAKSSRIMVSGLGQERIDLELTICLDGQTGTVHELEILNQLTIEILRFAESIGVKFGARYGQSGDFFLATLPSRN